MEETTIITTCKGRLQYLTHSVRSWLTHTPARVLVVNDGCPELTVETFRREQRVSVILTGRKATDPFHKPSALNLGASYASTSRLLFLDADTIVQATFWEWYTRRLTCDALIIAEPSTASRDLTGVLGVNAVDFEKVGGADEGMIGWGSEDLDLRLRLYLARGLRVVEIPPVHLESIPHDDDIRTLFYDEADKMVSHRKNLERLVRNAESISGQSIWSLLGDPSFHRLLGVAAYSVAVGGPTAPAET